MISVLAIPALHFASLETESWNLQMSCTELLQAELPKAVVVAPAPAAALQILKDLYESHDKSCQSKDVVEPRPKTKY